MGGWGVDAVWGVWRRCWHQLSVGQEGRGYKGHSRNPCRFGCLGDGAMLFLLGASRSGLRAVLLLYGGSTQRAPTHFLTPPSPGPPLAAFRWWARSRSHPLRRVRWCPSPRWSCTRARPPRPTTSQSELTPSTTAHLHTRTRARTHTHTNKNAHARVAGAWHLLPTVPRTFVAICSWVIWCQDGWNGVEKWRALRCMLNVCTAANSTQPVSHHNSHDRRRCCRAELIGLMEKHGEP